MERAGQTDSKKQLTAAAESLMVGSIVQTLGMMMDAVVF